MSHTKCDCGALVFCFLQELVGNVTELAAGTSIVISGGQAKKDHLPVVLVISGSHQVAAMLIVLHCLICGVATRCDQSRTKQQCAD